MKILQLLTIYILTLSVALYADIHYQSKDAFGTWEVDKVQTRQLLQTSPNFSVKEVQNKMTFLVFTPNHKVDVKSIDTIFDWHKDSNATITFDNPHYYIHGTIKSIIKDSMLIEYTIKNKTYNIVYKKRPSFKATIVPIEDNLYMSHKSQSDEYSFFLFHDNRFTMVKRTLDYRKMLLFQQEDMSKDVFNGNKLQGTYLVDGETIYLFGFNQSKIEMISKSKFIYKTKYSKDIFIQKDKLLKRNLEHNNNLVNYAAVNLDIDILKLAFRYGYKLNEKQKNYLLFAIVENYKEHLSKITEEKRKKFTEVVKFLHQNGMKVDIQKEEYHQITNYTEIRKPKLDLIGDHLYKEAFLLIELGTKVSNLDLYLIMNTDYNKIDKELLNKFIDAYKFNPKGDKLIFSALKYDDFDIEKRFFDMGFNDTKAKDCCYEMDMVEYALVFAHKSKYQFLEYLLAHTNSSHPYKEMQHIIKVQEEMGKKGDKEIIKHLKSLLDKYKNSHYDK